MPEPVYLIERFDRRQGTDGWQRLHSIDACQLLELDRVFKYSAGSVDRLREISQRCTMRLVAIQSLYRWLLFNVLVGNTDAHLKNLSFLVAADELQLSPFYDLLSTAVYETQAFGKARWPNQVEMAWPIQDSPRIIEQNERRLVEAAQTLGIPEAVAKRQLVAMRRNILEQAPLILEEVQQANSDLLRQRPELAATFAGEMRCLRAIVHVVIQDMCRQTAS